MPIHAVRFGKLDTDTQCRNAQGLSPQAIQIAHDYADTFDSYVVDNKSDEAKTIAAADAAGLDLVLEAKRHSYNELSVMGTVCDKGSGKSYGGTGFLIKDVEGFDSVDYKRNGDFWQIYHGVMPIMVREMSKRIVALKSQLGNSESQLPTVSQHVD